MPDSLPDYLGRQVARTTISIRKAGDGLSKGLAIEPEVLEPGTHVHVVLDCVVSAHDHKLLDDINMWELQQVLEAETGTIIEASVVTKALADQRRKIEEHNEATKGITRLPGVEPTMAEHDQAHKDGQHDKLVKGCPLCEEEQAAAAAEKAAAKKAPAKRAPRKAPAKPAS